MESTRTWNRRARIAALLALFAGLPAAAQTFDTIDDFNDSDDEGWTHLTAGDVAMGDGRWELADQRYTLRSESAIGPGGSGQVFSTLDNSIEAMYQDGAWRAKVRINEPNAGAMVGTRITTVAQGLQSGYTLHLNPSTLDANAATLNRIDAGVPTVVGSLARTTFDINEDTDYWLEMRSVGGQMEVRIWQDGQTRPDAAQITASDDAHTLGRFMVGAFVNNQLATTPATATFDDVQFAEIDANPTTPTVGDVNDDRFVDLFWYNRASRDILAWHVDNSPGDAQFYLSSQTLDTLPDSDTMMVGRGDFNSDGYTDLVYRNQATGENTVLRNVGRNDESTQTLPSVASRDWYIVAVADFNADGASDLLWRNPKQGATILWLMDGTTVTSATTLPGVADRAWHPVGAGDLSGDDRADVVWRNQRTGETVVWAMVGSLVMQQYTLSANVTDQRWQIGEVADFTGDSIADLVWRDMLSGANVLWEMDGVTVANTFALPTVADLNWSFAGMKDAASTIKKDAFDASARAGIFWRNVGNGANLLWLMGSDSEVASVVALPSVGGTQWAVNALGDVNFDHKPDLIWRNAETGDNVLWLMNGTTLAGTVALPGASTEWHMFALADANNDGVNDIYWHNSTNGALAIWLLDGTPADESVIVGAINLVGESDLAWSPKGADDIDHNGSPDIVWRNDNGSNAVWFMSGTVVSEMRQIPAVADMAWEIAKVSDMNDDQIPDLVWHNNATGATTVWLLDNQDSDLYAGAIFLPDVTDTSWQIQEHSMPTALP